ncbi:N-6 DNA methylase [Lentisphaera marina]|uniref:N-6 DNA methylase n=1 Tax=Lentisphaera marina TaxID=1111041 RepID=UPI00236640A9|nr:N-6 DNA methylase [Lentisphaera marina]MDD7984699.1 N-6 DNA methylase [Lentisphaera marina]
MNESEYSIIIQKEKERLGNLAAVSNIKYLEKISFQIFEEYRGVIKSDDYVSLLIYLLAMRKFYEDSIWNDRLCTNVIFGELDERDIRDLAAVWSRDSDVDLDIEYLFKTNHIYRHTIYMLDTVSISSIPREELYKFFIKLVENQRTSSQFWNSISPPLVVELAVKILDPKSRERLFNPASGLASFYIQSQIKHNADIYLDATEINVATANVSRALMSFLSLYKYDIQTEDVTTTCLPSNHYDLAFSIPPFSLRLNNFQRETLEFGETFFPFRPINKHLEFSILDKMLSSTKSRMAIVLRQGTIRSIPDRKYINYLLEMDLLEAMITLPPKIFPNTSIPTVMLIINKNKPSVKEDLVQVTNCHTVADFQQTVVDYNTSCGSLCTMYLNRFELLESGLDKALDLSIYKLHSNLREKEYRTLASILGEIPTKPTSGFKLNPSEYIVNSKDIRDLKSLDLSLDLHGIPLSDVRERRRYMKLPKHCVLTDIQMKHCVWVDELYKETVYCSDTVHCLKVNPEVMNARYLAYLLENDKDVKKQIGSLFTGAGMPRIHKSQFDSILIPVPNLATQSQELAEFHDLLIEKEQIKHEARIEQLTSKKKQEEHEFKIVSTIRHNLSNKVAPIRADLKLIERFIKAEGLEQEPIRPKLREADEVPLATEIIMRMHKNMNLMNNVLDSTRKVLELRFDESDFKVEKTRSFLKKRLPQTNSGDSYQLLINEEDPKLLIHPESFLEVFDQLIKNARTHAFTEGGENLIEINIEDQGKDVQITCFNTGKPFPKDFTAEDFLSINVKSQSSEGTGIGGYYIARTLQAHKAKLEIKPSVNGTEFIMIFPKKEEG